MGGGAEGGGHGAGTRARCDAGALSRLYTHSCHKVVPRPRAAAGLALLRARC